MVLQAKQGDQRGDAVSSQRSPAAMRFNFGVAALAKYCLLIILVGLLAALATWSVLNQLPKQYTSVVYLRIGQSNARTADALMHSTPILDAVLAKSDVAGSTIEERRRRLDAKRSLTLSPGEFAASPTMYKQEVTDPVPARARELNAAFVDAWLEATKPFPLRKAFLESEIARLEEQLKWTDDFLEQFRKQPAIPELPERTLNSQWSSGPRIDPQARTMPAETRAPGIASLLAQRNEAKAAISQLHQELLGVRRDVILAEPTLPEEPSWPRPLLLIPLAVAAAEILLLIVLALKEVLSARRRA